jgi:hypothetical protein
LSRGRERRRHQRQQRRDVDGGEEPARQLTARCGEREQKAQCGPGAPDQQGEQQAVAERLDLMPVGQHRNEAGGGEPALIGQHPDQQHCQRVDHEQRQQRPEHEHGRCHRRIVADSRRRRRPMTSCAHCDASDRAD